MEIAERTGAHILSVDSMQVYRGMDIGTAKPVPSERERVPHHMIDVAEPEEPYTVADFRRDARRALHSASRATAVLIVGGSGLHFRSVVDPMRFRATDARLRAELERTETAALIGELQRADRQAGDYVDLANPRRVIRAVEALRLEGTTPSSLALLPERADYEAYVPELEFIGVALDRSDLDDAVGRRLAEMRRRGLLEEVESLASRLGPTAAQAVGYRQLLDVVQGRLDEEAGWEQARRATLRLARRQRTFFRRDPRLRWFDSSRPDLYDVVSREIGL